MLDISTTHPVTACADFAMKWLDQVAQYNLQAAESLVDVNESGISFAECLPQPDGFTYCPIDQIKNWSMHIVAADEDGLSCDFELPFLEEEFRAMYARFDMTRSGNSLVVKFLGIVPS